MKISITQHDIDEGRRAIARGDDTNCHCPVANSLTKATGQAWCVGTRHCWPLYEHYRYRELPDAAREWIAEFDYGHDVEPFEFELELEPCH